MTLALTGWLFTFGVLVHNLEEMLQFPAWSSRQGRWRVAVGTWEFCFAAVSLSVLLLVIASASVKAPADSVAAHLMAGFALAMVLNVFVPHVIGTLVTRRYVPGTATAVLLNLPLGSLYLWQSLSRHHVSGDTFLWTGPLVVLATVATIPALFAVAHRWNSVPGLAER